MANSPSTARRSSSLRECHDRCRREQNCRARRAAIGWRNSTLADGKNRWPKSRDGRWRRRNVPKPTISPPRSGAALSPSSPCRRRSPRTRSPAPVLGVKRAGSGVAIDDDGLVLTIGYLITEAETIWLTTPERTAGSRPSAGDRPGIRSRARAGARPARIAGGPARAIPGRASRRSGGDRLRRSATVRRSADRRQARIRRLLGISPRRGHFHRPRASVLGRRRSLRQRWPAHRRRLAARRKRRRARRAERRQHDRADRPVAAADGASAAPAAASKGRRGRGSASILRKARVGSSSPASPTAARPPPPGFAAATSSPPSARRRWARSRISTAECGLAVPPASKSRSKWCATAAASGCACAPSSAAPISRDRASIDPLRFAPACAAPHIQSKPRRSRRALPRSPLESHPDRH